MCLLLGKIIQIQNILPCALVVYNAFSAVYFRVCVGPSESRFESHKLFESISYLL